MKLRYCNDEDIPLLAELNQQLIEDERAPNDMSQEALAERLRGWLDGEYRAVFFETSSEVFAYALYRPSEDGLYLRQFFVARSRRGEGLGRRAIALFREEVICEGQVLSLEAYAHNEEAIAFWQSVGFSRHTVSFRLSSS